jgi:hypothetical protein
MTLSTPTGSLPNPEHTDLYGGLGFFISVEIFLAVS